MELESLSKWHIFFVDLLEASLAKWCIFLVNIPVAVLSMFRCFAGRLVCARRDLLKAPRALSSQRPRPHAMDAVPEVEIDPEGTFKYVLVKLYGPEGSRGEEPAKMLVRGFKSGQFHSDIYDTTLAAAQQLGLDTECVGGGKITHDPEKKLLNVFGYSQGFGKADHAVTASLLSRHFPEYTVTVTDDGY